MWIARAIESLLRRAARQFPAVLVTGARQTGKTSLLRRVFPRASYLTLDLPANAEAARTSPDELLAAYPAPVIVDEIQYAPSLLRHLKLRIDQDRSPGRYLLTGSQSFALMQGVSESLAGRCAVLALHTLSRAELLAAGHRIPQARYLFLGGYPELHAGTDPALWYPAYVATYLERDVRNVLQVADLPDWNRFLRACALRTAQVVNYSDLARDAAIAPNTARKWLGLLQTSGIVTLLEPWFGNRLKRLVKAPKLVFLDTGLAAFLAGFRSERELVSSPLVGAFWETHVHGEIARQASLRPGSARPAYWRTAGGPEVDMVLERGGGDIVAIECKWSEEPASRDAAGLEALERAEGGRVKEKMLVCRTKVPWRMAGGVRVVPLESALRTIARR